jgi:hypothetical protein
VGGQYEQWYVNDEIELLLATTTTVESYLTTIRIDLLLSFSSTAVKKFDRRIDGIAATTSGFDCISRLAKETSDIVSIHNCTVLKNGIAKPCRFGRYTPGSNLYFACWTCLLSAVVVALKWKTAKALKFAKSKSEKRQQALDQAGGEAYGVVDDEAH